MYNYIYIRLIRLAKLSSWDIKFAHIKYYYWVERCGLKHTTFALPTMHYAKLLNLLYINRNTDIGV